MLMTGPEHGQEIGNMLYGMQGMSSDQPEVLALLVKRTRLINNYEGILHGQVASLHNDRFTSQLQ